MWPGYHELVQDLLHNVSEEVYEWDTNGYYYVYVDFRDTGASEEDLKRLANHYGLQVHLTHDPGSGPQNLMSRRGRTRRANSAFFYPRQGQFDYWKNLSYTILDPKRAQRDRDDYYSGRWTTHRRNPLPIRCEQMPNYSYRMMLQSLPDGGRKALDSEIFVETARRLGYDPDIGPQLTPEEEISVRFHMLSCQRCWPMARSLGGADAPDYCPRLRLLPAAMKDLLSPSENAGVLLHAEECRTCASWKKALRPDPVTGKYRYRELTDQLYKLQSNPIDDATTGQLDVNGHQDYGFSKLNISIGPGWDDEWMLDIYGDQESGLKLFFDDLQQLRDFNQRLGKHIDDAIDKLGN